MRTLKELSVYARNQRVLVIEDEATLNRQLRDFLARFYRQVDSEFDGRAGYEKFRNNAYDIVITDINMPNMNGIELCAAIKRMAPEQKILVISAYNQTDYFVELINIGIDGFLLKPLKTHRVTQKLLEISEAITHRQRFEQELARRLLHAMKTGQTDSLPRSLGDVLVKEVSDLRLQQTEPQETDDRSGLDSHQVVSAQDFISDLQDDSDIWEQTLEDIEQLADINADLDILISGIMSQGLHADSVEQFSSIFYRYAQTLGSFNQFHVVGTALRELSEVVDEFDADHCDDRHKQRLSILLEAIADDIDKFTRHVFILQDARDIHYLDETIVANIEQLKLSFRTQETPAGDDAAGVDEDDDDMDLELF